MPHRAAGFLLILGGVLSSTPATAQVVPEPPGPYVIDVRGVSSGLPQDTVFVPPVVGGAFVPSRGNGFDVGGHVYSGRFRGARLGFGANFVNVRGKAAPPTSTSSTTARPSSTPPTIEVTLRMIVPQVSLNFGTADGWSYLSGGAGVSDVSARTLDVAEASQGGGRRITINVGGGARWFLRRRLAVGFDARLHRLGKTDTTTSTMQFSIAAGISLR